ARQRVQTARGQIEEGRQNLRWARQVALVRGRRESEQKVLMEIHRIYSLTERAATTLEMVGRYGWGEILTDGADPAVAGLVGQLTPIFEDLSSSVRDFQPPLEARQLATQLAEQLSPTGRDEESWRSTVIVSLVRSTVMDILQMTGLSRVEAWQILPDGADESGTIARLPEDEASDIWGDQSA
ncbi:MAG: hypothetical protein LBL92_06050, partial [Propionibacteriaceae bacterium]|nr:hypothetical protein [Propionibacteriaceae bacterium]